MIHPTPIPNPSHNSPNNNGGGGGKKKNRRRPIEGFPVKNVLSRDGVPPGMFPVMDPCSRKLFVPMQCLLNTRALHREGVPSLCKVFLMGRCHQGENCFQAHADPNVILMLREAALREPSCCKGHGANSEAEGIAGNTIFTLHSEDGHPFLRIGLDQLVVTKGLRTIIAETKIGGPIGSPPDVKIPFSSLCRLHTRGGQQCCRFDHDCNFVHVCREIVNQLSHNGVTYPMPLLGGAASISPFTMHGTDLPGSPGLEENYSTAVCPSSVSQNHHNSSSHSNNPLCTQSSRDFSQHKWSPHFQAAPNPAANNSTSRFVVPPTDLGAATCPLAESAMGGNNCSSGLYDATPLQFDPSVLANGPWQQGGPNSNVMGSSPSQMRSFCSTPGGLVWRHNPYGSSCASSVVET